MFSSEIEVGITETLLYVEKEILCYITKFDSNKYMSSLNYYEQV